MSGGLEGLLRTLRESAAIAQVEMGLTTPDLVGRYQFFAYMQYASPRHERWDYHPETFISPGCCLGGEPWSA